MIGVGDALGFAIIFSLILIVYVPLISVIVLRDLDIIKNEKTGIRIVKYSFLYLILLFVTIIIIRNFKASAFDGLFAYSSILTLVALINWVIREREKNSS